MIMQITANLYECKHCSGSGTCTNGRDADACLACARKNELSFWQRKNQKGLACGCCGGIGRAEPMTERMNNRMAPLLALLLTFFLFVLIFVAVLMTSPYFSEIIAFSGAIIGSVAGFYFSSNHKAG
jgi:hypothetical protein